MIVERRLGVSMSARLVMEMIRADASHTRVPLLCLSLPPTTMASQLKTLYEELGRAFYSKPTDLKKCSLLLPKLKVEFLTLHILNTHLHYSSD